MLMLVMLFLFLSLSAILAMSTPVLRQASVVSDFLKSRQSYFLAEAGVEDLIYKIKNNKQTFTTDTLSLNGITVTTSLSGSTDTKTIDSSETGSGLIRKVEAVVKTGVGSAFNYGIQSGAGGFILGNNATIHGSVYANGSITGSNGASITGTAISANSPASSADQDNSSPATPPNSVQFGDASSDQDLAQSFQVSTLGPLTKISVYLKKTSSPGNLTVRITTGSSGQPSSSNTIVSATLSNSLVTTSYGWVDVTMPSYVQLTPGTTYWLVLDGINSSSKYYTIGANSSYGSGQAKIGQYGGSWSNTSPSGLDAYFKIYLGGLNGLISGMNVGSAGVGDAQAHEVDSSTVAAHLYCQAGSGNNKSCDTSKADPTALDLPISDSNINEWKSEAAAGTVVNGSYNASSNVTIGPEKIVGNLTTSNGGTVSRKGVVWVTGDINLPNNANIKLDSSYGSDSSVLNTERRVIDSNNPSCTGNGQSGSYIMTLTTSDCPISDSCAGAYAMDISNNAGAVILNAQKGTIHMNNGAAAKQLTAYKIYFDNNSNINYEQGIANTAFTNGPTGGWNIKSWQETE